MQCIHLLSLQSWGERWRKEKIGMNIVRFVWADVFTTSGEKEDWNLYISIIISSKEKNTSSHYFVSPTRNIVSLSFFSSLTLPSPPPPPASLIRENRERKNRYLTDDDNRLLLWWGRKDEERMIIIFDVRQSLPCLLYLTKECEEEWEGKPHDTTHRQTINSR